MESVEFVVVGAGLAGLSAAWRLAANGREVVVLEHFALGHTRGSSHGPTRIFRFAYDDPVYVRMARAALPLWRELETATGEELLRVTGGLDLGPRGRLDEIASALASCGASSEILDAAERRVRFPWLEAGGTPALHSPDTGVIAAARAIEALASAARTAGAELREERPVRAVEPGADRVTVGGDWGRIEARRCVVAAGAWAGPLLASLGIRLPLRVTREQVFYYRGLPDLIPFIDYAEPMRYAVPPFAGSAGVKVAEHMSGEETSAEGRSFEMDPEGAARVAAYVTDTLPRLDPEPVAFETCLYTTTPDEGFLIHAAGPLVIASACSGHGFKFGPIVGEIVACMATGGEPPVPAEPFSRARFGV